MSSEAPQPRIRVELQPGNFEVTGSLREAVRTDEADRDGAAGNLDASTDGPENGGSSDETMAVSLSQQARQFTVTGQLARAADVRHAAKLLVRSAELRENPLGDEAFDAFGTAGHLYYYGERPRKALGAHRRAAEIAGRRGEVYTKAIAHLHLARLAGEIGDVKAVIAHRDWARTLALSSHLTPKQSQDLAGSVRMLAARTGTLRPSPFLR